VKKIVITVTLLLCLSFAWADFTGLNQGARMMGVGNAFVGGKDDPTAVLLNPASLAVSQHVTMAISHENVYGIGDLWNDMLVATYPLKEANIALSIRQLALSNDYSEMVTGITYSKVLVDKSVKLSFGVTGKHEYAHVKSMDNVSDPETDIAGVKLPGRFDFDAGVAFDYKQLRIGVSGLNLAAPSFCFDQNSTEIKRELVAGWHYAWADDIHFYNDFVWRGNRAIANYGSEIWFFNTFAPRIGISDNMLTAGFGLKAKKWKVDGAVYAHEHLGSTYRLQFGWIFR